MASSVVSNEMYVILGASGNTGSIIANSLLSVGKKVRVVGRDSGRLQRFVDKGQMYKIARACFEKESLGRYGCLHPGGWEKCQ